MQSNYTGTKAIGAAAVSPPASRLFRTLIVVAGCGSLAAIVVLAAQLSGERARHSPASDQPPSEASALPAERGLRATSAMAAGDGHRAATTAFASTAPAPESTEAPALAPPKTARDEREQMVSELRASGPSRESWTTAASKLFETLEPVLDPDRKAKQSKVECFHEGCVRTTTFASVAESEASLRALKEFPSFLHWPGIKSRTGSEYLPDGQVMSAIFLYRPETAHNTN
jgi:hypothetical protein